MRKILYIAATALLCASCFQVNTNYKGGKNGIIGEGPVISKSFDLQGFDAICVNGNADVVFTQSDNWEVTVRTQENVIDQLDYKVENGVLVIQTKGRRTVKAEEYDLTVKAPVLKDIEVNGASDFDIPAGLKTDGDLKVEVNGAGDLDFRSIVCGDLIIKANGASDINASNIDVKYVKVEINGAGDVDLSGKAGDASFEVNGAGDIDATGLKISGEVKRHTAGLASIKL